MVEQKNMIEEVAAEASTVKTIFKGKEVQIPINRLYTKEHMWMQIGKDSVRVGITEYVCRHIECEVALIELAKGFSLNSMVEQGQPFGTLYGEVYRVFDTREFECTAFDLYAPISGRIVKINPQVLQKPQIVGKDPYKTGWFAVIKPFEPVSASSNLMNAEEYKRYIMTYDKSPFRTI